MNRSDKMINFLLGISITINIIFVLGIILIIKLKDKLNPIKTIEKFYKEDVEDKNSFNAFFGS